MTLSNLQALTASLVRDINSGQPIFSTIEYSNAMDQAVREYSITKKRYLPYTLNLVAGQSQYTLPTDWITPDLETFNALFEKSENINYEDFAGFVLPSLNSFPDYEELEYTWYNEAQSLTVTPAPTSNMSLSFSYFALQQANGTTYSIPIQDEGALANLAASMLLDILAADRGTQMQKYKIGQGLAIDDSLVAVRLQELSKTYRANYDRMVNRPFGVMG